MIRRIRRCGVENKTGLLIVVSGPSGAGKGTICRVLLQQMPDLKYSVSMTTRDPRLEEEEGVHYYFYSRQSFKELVEREELLEWAEFCDNYYGTPRFAVEQALAEGRDILLEIETQGALQVKNKFPKGVFIFIIPPSLEVLAERIRNRGTESEEDFGKRIAIAAQELDYINLYDYVVVNDDVSVAVEKLKSILIAEKCRTSRNPVIFKEEF